MQYDYELLDPLTYECDGPDYEELEWYERNGNLSPEPKPIDYAKAAAIADYYFDDPFGDDPFGDDPVFPECPQLKNCF